MGRVPRTLKALPAVPAAAAAVVISQVMRAAHRRDLPSFTNQDPSCVVGTDTLPPLRMVALGDSSLTAPGIEDLCNVWVRRIATALSDRYCVELITLAVGGSKARDVIEGQLAEAIRLRPDIAVVSVGANDALRGVRVRRYRRELTEILRGLSTSAGSIVVFGMGDLASIPRLPPSLRPWTSRRSRLFNRAARDVAIAFSRAVKVDTRGRSTEAFFEDPSLFAGDQFHAGDEGHAVFAEDALEAFEAALAVRGLG